jgi:hypothetical protein
MGLAPAFLLGLTWLAQAAAPETAPEPEPPPPPPPPSLPAPPPAPLRYGDRGTSDLSVAIGYGDGGLVVGAGFRRFFWTGVAPGLEGTAQLGGNPKVGLVLGTLRFVPLSTGSLAITLTPKGGRVILSGHDDGWAVGGDAGIILMLAPGVGFELGYEVLRLLPASFCADLTSCTLQGPVLGLRIMF